MTNNLTMAAIERSNTLSGVFRLRKPSLRRSRRGRLYLKASLEDMGCALTAYLWDEELCRRFSLTDLSPAYVEGTLRHRQDGPVVDLELLASERITAAGEIVRLIPQSVCPRPWLLPFLQAAVERVTIPALAEFVASVLGDDGIAFPFVAAPASLNHHHNHPGGLLEHSLECVQMVARHREFAKTNFELGLVASLFHEIGKTLTMTAEMTRTSLGQSMDHEKLTLELLAPHLRRLDWDWPAGASELRYLLTWKLRQKVPRYDMADLVACCDRVSSGLDWRKRKH
jgi:3'-5' exoribonuclease